MSSLLHAQPKLTPEVRSILDPFIAYLTDRRCSKPTISGYSTDLSTFVEFLKERGKIDLFPKDLERHDFLAFVRTQVENGASKSTLARRLSGLRCFYKFAIQSKLLQQSPLDDILNPRISRTPLKHLTEADVRVLIESIIGQHWLDVRDRAILRLLCETGVRASELVGSNVSDFDAVRGLLCVRATNSKKERLIRIESGTMNTLDVWLMRHSGSPAKDCAYLRANYPCGIDPLFLNRFGTRLDVRSVRRILVKRLAKANLPPDSTPHTLRNSYVVNLSTKNACSDKVS